MKKEILAYMAGIIDGEGCLSISKQIRKDRRSPSYRISITVSNTDKRIVDLFFDYYKGTVYQRPDGRKDKNWADSYTWYCKHSVSVKFLTDIMPYLLIKKEQAKKLILFQTNQTKYVRKSLGVGRGSAPLSQKEIDDKEKQYLYVKSLNKKGLYSRSLTNLTREEVTNATEKIL